MNTDVVFWTLARHDARSSCEVTEFRSRVKHEDSVFRRTRLHWKQLVKSSSVNRGNLFECLRSSDVLLTCRPVLQGSGAETSASRATSLWRRSTRSWRTWRARNSSKPSNLWLWVWELLLCCLSCGDTSFAVSQFMFVVFRRRRRRCTCCTTCSRTARWRAGPGTATRTLSPSLSKSWTSSASSSCKARYKNTCSVQGQWEPVPGWIHVFLFVCVPVWWILYSLNWLDSSERLRFIIFLTSRWQHSHSELNMWL